MHDDIDRLLSEDEIAPSSGFLASVMDAVEREAARPERMAFPWLRALPGLLAAAAALVAGAWAGARALSDPVVMAAIDGQMRQLAVVASRAGVQWMMLAVATTAVSVTLAAALTRTGGGTDR